MKLPIILLLEITTISVWYKYFSHKTFLCVAMLTLGIEGEGCGGFQ